MNPRFPVSSEDRLTRAYSYQLPADRIAQVPVSPRDRARLLVVTPTGHHHSHFTELPGWLRAGDLLVFNDTRVIPARLFGQRSTGAHIEILLLEQLESVGRWLALVKPGKRVRVGDRITFAPQVMADVEASDEATGGRVLQFRWPEDLSFEQVLDQLGQIPFPPYITERWADPEEYQTIWARHRGSVAAPTAGLHFTEDLLHQLQEKGINSSLITLSIGLGTFRPVEVEQVEKHQIHREWLRVSEETTQAIRQTQASGGRVIAVGTTVVRALETAAQSGSVQPWEGKSDLFIYPGYPWQVVEGLITNFHLPRSSLLMLVSALIGRERLLSLYAEAIDVGYRFYSFGDGMLILPEQEGMDQSSSKSSA